MNPQRGERFALVLVLTVACVLGACKKEQEQTTRSTIFPTSSTTLGGAGYQSVSALDANAESTAISGTFFDNLEMDEHHVRGGGELDGFVATLNKEGAVQWVQVLSGPGDEDLVDVLLLQDGRTVTCGRAGSGSELGNGPLAGADGTHAIVAQFSHDGAVEWVVTSSGGGAASATGAAQRNDGSLIVVGDFSGVFELGEFSLATEGTTDIFLAVISKDGSVESLHHLPSLDGAHASGILVRGAEVYVVGSFSGGLVLPEREQAPNPISITTPFLARLDVDGFVEWVRVDLLPEYLNHAEHGGHHEHQEHPYIEVVHVAASLNPEGGVSVAVSYGEMFGLHGEASDFESATVGSIVVSLVDAYGTVRSQGELGGPGNALQLGTVCSQGSEADVIASWVGQLPLGDRRIISEPERSLLFAHIDPVGDIPVAEWFGVEGVGLSIRDAKRLENEYVVTTRWFDHESGETDIFVARFPRARVAD